MTWHRAFSAVLLVALLGVAFLGAETVWLWVSYTGDDSDPSRGMAVLTAVVAALGLAMTLLGLRSARSRSPRATMPYVACTIVVLGPPVAFYLMFSPWP